MGYLKTFISLIIIILITIFMFQNIESLSQPLVIRLNLIFLKFESNPYSTYLIIIFSCFGGILAASLVGINKRFKMRKEIKKQRKGIESLNREIDLLRNLALNKKILNAKKNNSIIP